jgi:hypothetical protein
MTAWTDFLMKYHNEQKKQNSEHKFSESMKGAAKIYKENKKQMGGMGEMGEMGSMATPSSASVPVQPMPGSSSNAIPPATDSTSDFKPDDLSSQLVKTASSMAGGKKSKKVLKGKKSKTSKKRRSSRRK